MGDYDRKQPQGIPEAMVTRYKDMGDGTHAQVGAIGRGYNYFVVTIPAGESLINSYVDLRPYAGGFIRVGDAWTDANIGFDNYVTKAGTYYAGTKDSTGSLIQITNISTAAAYWYEIPEQCFGLHLAKIRSCATAGTGVNVNQAAERTLVLAVKG